MKKNLLAFAAIIFFGGLIFAQDEPPVTPPSADTQTTSEADAIVIFNQGDNNSRSTTSRQFISSIPGPTTYVIPGNAPSGKTKETLIVPFKRVITMEEMKNMSARITNPVADALIPWRWGGKKRIFTVTYLKGVKAKNNNPVTFVDWDPRLAGFPGDKILGEVTIRGDAWWPESKYIAEGVKECKEKTNTERVAMLRYEVVASKTEMSIKGLGMSGSSVNGSNDVSLGTAIGYGKGTSTSFPETWPVYTMVCMNDGPTSRPVKDLCTNIDGIQESVPRGLVQKGSICVEPDPALKEKKDSEKSSQEHVVRIVVEQLPPPMPQAVPVPQTPASAPKAEKPAAEDPCEGMPRVSIYFNHDKSNIRDQKERSKIERVASWVKEHQLCQIQVRANASASGSTEYNNTLAMNRAISVTKVLEEFGVSRIQFVSGGEYNTLEGTEYSQADRRAVFQAIKAASGE